MGIAGGTEKCRFVAGDLGFDACVDHRAPDFAKQLEAACPKGIDVYFENISGAYYSRWCGLCSTILRASPCAGSSRSTTRRRRCPGPDMFSVLRKRLLLRGFIVSDFAAKQGDFLRDVGEWVRTVRIKYREDISTGWTSAASSSACCRVRISARYW